MRMSKPRKNPQIFTKIKYTFIKNAECYKNIQIFCHFVHNPLIIDEFGIPL